MNYRKGLAKKLICRPGSFWHAKQFCHIFTPVDQLLYTTLAKKIETGTRQRAQARDLSSMHAPVDDVRACFNFFGQSSSILHKNGPTMYYEHFTAYNIMTLVCACWLIARGAVSISFIYFLNIYV